MQLAHMLRKDTGRAAELIGGGAEGTMRREAEASEVEQQHRTRPRLTTVAGAFTVSIRRGPQCRLSAERSGMGLHGVEDTVGSERFDRFDEIEAAMEAEPFSGVAMPLDVEAVGADPVEASEGASNSSPRFSGKPER